MNPYGRTETDHEPPPPYGGAQGAAHRFAQDLEKARYTKDTPEVVLGKGGIGQVVVAHETLLRRPVAMKTLLPEHQAAEHLKERLIREARITGILEHPSIVPVHDIGESKNGEIFFTMKKVEGMTLGQIIKRLATATEELIPEETEKRADVQARFGSIASRLEIIQKICDAIAFAHSHPLRVIHRDLKPDNIMVGRFGEVLVMDWGLAKVLGKGETAEELRQFDPKGGDANDLSPQGTQQPFGPSFVQLSQEGQFNGTLLYAAPEQIEGRQAEIDERCDIYALGGILYHLLTLEPPLPVATKDETDDGNAEPHSIAEQRAQQMAAIKAVLQMIQNRQTVPHVRSQSSARTKDKRIPEALLPVIQQALEPAPVKRIPSIAAFKQAIGDHLGGFANQFENAGAWKHFSYFVKRHKAVSITTTLSLVAITIVAGIYSSNLRTALDDKEAQRKIAVGERNEKQEALANAKALNLQKDELIKKQDFHLRQASKLDHEAALRAIEQGDHALGLAHFCRSLEYRPDNTNALVGSASYAFGINSQAWHVRSVINTPGEHIFTAKFSPDGTLLALGGGEVATDPAENSRGSICMVDCESGEQRWVMRFDAVVSDIVFSSDGKSLILEIDGNVITLDASTGNRLRQVAVPRLGNVTLSPDGKHFTRNNDGGQTLRLVETASGKEKCSLDLPSSFDLLPLFKKDVFQKRFEVFSADGHFLAAASTQGVPSGENDASVTAISVVATNDGGKVREIPINGELRALKISQDGSHILVTVRNGSRSPEKVYLMPSNRGKQHCLGESYKEPLFSPDGQLCAVQVDSFPSKSHTHIYDTIDVKLLADIDASGALSFSPDGNLLAIADGENPGIFQSRTGKASLRLAHRGKAHATLFSPDAHLCLIIEAEEIWIYDAVTGKEISRIPGLGNAVFRPDGGLILATGHQQHFLFEPGYCQSIGLKAPKDLDEANILRQEGLALPAQYVPIPHSHKTSVEEPTAGLLPFPTNAMKLTFTEDGKICAWIDWLGEIHIQETTTGRSVGLIHIGALTSTMGNGSGPVDRLVTSEGQTVDSIALSPDGQILTLAGTSSDGEGANYFRRIKTASGNEISKVRFGGGFDHMVFSPDGGILVAGNAYKQSLSIIDVLTGRELGGTHLFGTPFGAAFSHDKTLCAVWDEGGHLQIVDTSSGRLLADDPVESVWRPIAFSPKSNYIIGMTPYAIQAQPIRGQGGEVTVWPCHVALSKKVNSDSAFHQVSHDGKYLWIVDGADDILRNAVRIVDSTWFLCPDLQRNPAWDSALKLQSRLVFTEDGKTDAPQDLLSLQAEVHSFVTKRPQPAQKWQHDVLKWVNSPPQKRTTSPWTDDPVRYAVGRWIMQENPNDPVLLQCANIAPWHPLEPLSLTLLGNYRYLKTPTPIPLAAKDGATPKSVEPNRTPEITVADVLDDGTDGVNAPDTARRSKYLARMTLNRLRDSDENLYGRETLAEYAAWAAKVMHEELHLDAEALEAVNFALERTPKADQGGLLELKNKLTK